MHPDWMWCILFSLAQSIPIECSGFYAASLNAEDSMHCGAMDPDCMQWILCSMAQTSRLNAVDSMQRDWMQCNPWSVVKCIPIECSGFHAAWRNGTLLNAVDFMQHDWLQWIRYSMIECSGYYAAWPKASWLNAVDSMQRDWMQWIPCSVIECSGFHAAW